MMNVLEKAQRILQLPVCNNCIGRQFAKLLSGYTNEERGSILRSLVAMSIDREDFKNSEGLEPGNFAKFEFHNTKIAGKENPCEICLDTFKSLDKWVEKIAESRLPEFNTFLIGTKLSSELIEKEEELWEMIGIDYCEQIKAELNRELGKCVEKKLGVKFSKNPDVNFIVNFDSNKVEMQINPVFIYGEYKKLVRGIPQTRWPSGKYKNSVEQIIAKPFMKVMRAKGHKFHGCGREDIDARCLDWRPFVLEFIEPQKRNVNLKLSKKVNSKVLVQKLRFSDIRKVRIVKESRNDKTYHALVICGSDIQKKGLKKLKKLIGEINQKTPTRVLHRRADMLRRRKVKLIKARYVSPKVFDFTVTGEAGLYIKELISGDDHRTWPSVSSILDNKCICKNLDVIKIHKSRSRKIKADI